MQLNSDQKNLIYFPPKESDYFDLKTKFLNKNLPSQYDNSLIKKKDSTTCRFPSILKSFKEEVDQNKSVLDVEKINVLTNKPLEERDEVERYEIFLYEINNPDEVSDNEKVTVVDPLDEGGNSIEVLYNDLVNLLCIYKQYFRSKYKIGPTTDEIDKYKQFEKKLFNKDNKIDDVQGFKISGSNSDDIASTNDVNVVTNSSASDSPFSDTQTSEEGLNIVTNSLDSNLSSSESSLTKENIDEIVNKVIEGLKESLCKKNISKGGKRLKTRIRKKKHKHITNVRKKRSGKKSYKKKVKKTKKKVDRENIKKN